VGRASAASGVSRRWSVGHLGGVNKARNSLQVKVSAARPQVVSAQHGRTRITFDRKHRSFAICAFIFAPGEGNGLGPSACCPCVYSKGAWPSSSPFSDQKKSFIFITPPCNQTEEIPARTFFLFFQIFVQLPKACLFFGNKEGSS
jgi:hypothetical protein